MNDNFASLEEAYNILLEKLGTWFEVLVEHLPNAVVAVTIFCLFLILASAGQRLGNRFFTRAFDTGAVASLLSTILKVSILFLGIFFALGVLGLQKTVLSLLAGAGIIGIALGFAFQDLAENLIAGITMGIRKPFKTGDLIETHGELGFVESLNLRNSILVNFSGQRILIPNKEVFQNKLTNYSQTGARRIEIDVGIPFDADVDHATSVAKDAIKSKCDDWLHPEKSIDAFALSFGHSSISLSIRYWIRYPGDKSFFEAIHDGIKSITSAFHENEIKIPYPIRTLNTADGLDLKVDKEAFDES